MPVDVTHVCKACGVTAVFRLAEKVTIWDHGFSPCYTCAALHYVCSPCLERLGLAEFRLSDRRLPCFGSDEFRVAAAVMVGEA